MSAPFLRPRADADAAALYQQQLDPEANAMCASTPRDRDAYLEHWARSAADPSVVHRTVVVAGAPAGYVARFERYGKPEVCYWFGREHWGKGLATEALKVFLGELAERPLYARVAKRNPASRRVLEKCGFAVIAEETYENRDGEKVDEYLLRLG